MWLIIGLLSLFVVLCLIYFYKTNIKFNKSVKKNSKKIIVAALGTSMAMGGLMGLPTDTWNIQAELIDELSDYEAYGYDLSKIINPIVYESEVLCEGHLPLAIRITGKDSIVASAKDMISINEIRKDFDDDIDYTIKYLSRIDFTYEEPIYKKFIVKNGSKNGTILYENYTKLIGNKTIHDYKYIWKELKSIKDITITKSKYIIIDIIGKFKASLIHKSIDVIPIIKIKDKSKEFKEFAWWNNNWTYKKSITLNHSQVCSTLINFPVLISIVDGNLASHAQADGDDICFTNSAEDIQLNHEIEAYTSGTGTLVAWVNITSLSSSVDTVIYMYYGNAGATNQEHAADTWNDDFKVVYHMNDSSTSTIDDSTINAADGTKQGANAPNEVTAKIAKGQDFSGITDYIQEDTSSFDIGTTVKFVSWWMYLDTVQDTEGAFQYGADNAGGGYNYFRVVSDDHSGNYKLMMMTRDGAGNYDYDDNGLASAITGAWHYFVFAFNGTSKKFFIDGDEVTLTGYIAAGSVSSNNINNNQILRLGRTKSGATYYYYDGKIDEFRISDVSRSDCWINTNYNTVNNATDGGFFTMGAEQSSGGWSNTAPTITPDSENPPDTQTGVAKLLTNYYNHFNITVADVNNANQSINVTWRTNESGTWKNMGYNESTECNSTFYCTNISWVDEYETLYYWSVNVSDNATTKGWVNATYSFTTILAPAVRKYTTWNQTYQWTKHAYDDALYLAQVYGQYNLTPMWMNDTGMSGTQLYPFLLPVSLSMYKITHNVTYLNRARGCADDIQNYMLNTTTNIIRVYNNDTGVNDSTQTMHNAVYLVYIADLAMYDSNYNGLAENVSKGIIDYFVSNVDATYNYVYPDGSTANTNCKLPSNGGTLSIIIKGLLRTYEATGNTTIRDKAYDILTAVWTNTKTGVNLIPTIFNANNWNTVDDDAQQYASGELLGSYDYYYALTGNQTIKNIIDLYSSAIYQYYWDATDNGEGHFMYEVDVDTGAQNNNILEINWHKMEMPLWYSGEITDTDFSYRIGANENTSWLTDWGGTIDYGLAYVDTPGLFRHGTYANGNPYANHQSLLYATMRSSLYSMLRMQKQGMYDPTTAGWNTAIYDHCYLTQHYHNKTVYMYYGSMDTASPYPPASQALYPLAGTFSSMITLLLNTTSNVNIQWENWSHMYATEPFESSYESYDMGYMQNVTFDYDNRCITLDKVTSNGTGKINITSEKISQVTKNDIAYNDWYNSSNTSGMINTTTGTHKYVIVLSGGSFPNVAPTVDYKYPANNSIGISTNPTCEAYVNDTDGDTLTVTWASNCSGVWLNYNVNTSVAADSIVSYVYSCFSENNTDYYWQVYVYDGEYNISEIYHFTTVMIRNYTIRHDGIDYFCYLNDNTTASMVAANITGFDTIADYMQIWDSSHWDINNWLWVTYYGDGSGTDFNINYYDIVRIYLNYTSDVTYDMPYSGAVNLSNCTGREVILTDNTLNRQYNYSCYCCPNNATMSVIGTSMGLTAGERLAVWNTTSYEWNAYIMDFTSSALNHVVEPFSVLETKVDERHAWVMC